MADILSWTTLVMTVGGIFIGHALGKRQERDNRNYHALVTIKEKLYLALDNERGYVGWQAPTDEDIHRAKARLSRKRAVELSLLFSEYSDAQKRCSRNNEFGEPTFTIDQLSRYRRAADELLKNL